MDKMIILILIYIGSHTAQEAGPQAENPAIIQYQEVTVCTVEKTNILPGNFNLETCYRTNTFCEPGDLRNKLSEMCILLLKDAFPPGDKQTTAYIISTMPVIEPTTKNTILMSTVEPPTEITTIFNADTTRVPGTENASLNSGHTTDIGIAVGTALGTIIIICIVAAVLIVHRKRAIYKKDIVGKDKNHENCNDYIGDQEIVLPQTDTSAEYCELNTRYSSHKYTEGKHVPIKNPETTYDYIDDLDRKHLSSGNDAVTETSKFDPEKHLNASKPEADENDGNYTILDPEDVFTDLLTTTDPNKSVADYAVLDPNETGLNRSENGATLSNESYAVLDPAVTGYDRSNVMTGHDHSKAITTENDNNVSEQSTEDNFANIETFSQNENDYNTTKQQSKCQSKENLYHHSVDTVYDTASQNRENETPDNAYDHFFEHKTVDDFNMLKS